VEDAGSCDRSMRTNRGKRKGPPGPAAILHDPDYRNTSSASHFRKAGGAGTISMSGTEPGMQVPGPPPSYLITSSFMMFSAWANLSRINSTYLASTLMVRFKGS